MQLGHYNVIVMYECPRILFNLIVTVSRERSMKTYSIALDNDFCHAYHGITGTGKE